MSETRTTSTFGIVAFALLLLTWATAPRVSVPEMFADRGEILFPEFRDPNAATSLEVIEFDARTATVRPFKVQNRQGRWTIPSQYDYPADARDQLARTAAAVVALRRDDFASDSAPDHERCGVLDPLDATLPTLGGRGTRLIVRGERDQVLADVIIGHPVENAPGFRYVRQAGQRRVYISHVGDWSVSTAFGDWIERDLLQVTPTEIDAINLRNYSLDRTTRQVNPGDTLLLERSAGGAWTINGLGAREQLNLMALDGLLRNLASLTITGVLPKPAGISATLSQEIASAEVTKEDRDDLGRKGFYLLPTGELVSNRGEMIVRTTGDVFYTLRFGDIAPGTEVPAVPPAGADADVAPAPRENRYLFIMVDHDPRPTTSAARSAEGAEKTRLLRARFAPWYYVISANSIGALQLRRTDLVQARGPAG
jgi:hypothetical protein